MWLDGLCVLEGTESRSVPLERWVEDERETGTKVEVSGAPSSVSWGLTRTSPNKNPVNTAHTVKKFESCLKGKYIRKTFWRTEIMDESISIFGLFSEKTEIFKYKLKLNKG